MNSLDLFRAAGVALHGQRWQSDLARELGVAIRTVQRWDAGSHPIPDTIWLEMLDLLNGRAADITKLCRKIGRL
jgi:hypothetical protein